MKEILAGEKSARVYKARQLLAIALHRADYSVARILELTGYRSRRAFRKVMQSHGEMVAAADEILSWHKGA